MTHFKIQKLSNYALPETVLPIIKGGLVDFCEIYNLYVTSTGGEMDSKVMQWAMQLDYITRTSGYGTALRVGGQQFLNVYA